MSNFWDAPSFSAQQGRGKASFARENKVEPEEAQKVRIAFSTEWSIALQLRSSCHDKPIQVPVKFSEKHKFK